MNRLILSDLPSDIRLIKSLIYLEVLMHSFVLTMVSFLKIVFKMFFIFERERERVRAGEEKRQNRKQAPGPELVRSAQLTIAGLELMSREIMT